MQATILHEDHQSWDDTYRHSFTVFIEPQDEASVGIFDYAFNVKVYRDNCSVVAEYVFIINRSIVLENGEIDTWGYCSNGDFNYSLGLHIN